MCAKEDEVFEATLAKRRVGVSYTDVLLCTSDAVLNAKGFQVKAHAADVLFSSVHANDKINGFSL